MDRADGGPRRPPETAESSLHNHSITQILRGARYPSSYSGNTASYCDSHTPQVHDNPSQLPEEQKLTRRVRYRDEISIIIGVPVVLLLDLVAPCIIYYVWLDNNRSRWRRSCRSNGGANQICPAPPPVFDQWVLGLSIAFFGLGELYILLVRCYRLIWRHEEFAPLLSTRKWELDATAWVYASALLIALVPFVVSSSYDNGIPWLFLYSPALLVAYLEIWAIITLIPFKIPIRVDSDPAGSPVQPLLYYAAEDFMAVDGCQGREFRRRYQARYQTSPSFRRMILYLTLFWIAGCTIYIGCASAIIWNLRFEFAFGSTFGFLFFWIILWAILTQLWVHVQMG